MTILNGKEFQKSFLMNILKRLQMNQEFLPKTNLEFRRKLHKLMLIFTCSSFIKHFWHKIPIYVKQKYKFAYEASPNKRYFVIICLENHPKTLKRVASFYINLSRSCSTFQKLFLNSTNFVFFCKLNLKFILYGFLSICYFVTWKSFQRSEKSSNISRLWIMGKFF